MKDSYIAFVLEEYISSDNFDVVFGNDWIDDQQLSELYPLVCNYAFADYGIDADAKYASEAEVIFDGLRANNGIVRHGDDYTDYWYKLRPPYKKKFLDELRTKNPATKKVSTLGDEALRRALNKIVAEDDLRSSDDRWSEPSESSEDDWEAGKPASPNPNFFETEARKAEFAALTDDALKRVEESDLSNSDKSQAQGYLIAAKALSETPDPPVDIIWTILMRANSVAGIASFFVALITLIAMVA